MSQEIDMTYNEGQCEQLGKKIFVANFSLFLGLIKRYYVTHLFSCKSYIICAKSQQFVYTTEFIHSLKCKILIMKCGNFIGYAFGYNEMQEKCGMCKSDIFCQTIFVTCKQFTYVGCTSCENFNLRGSQILHK